MAYADEVLADSPWLYWQLDETSGTNANDATANNRDGTYFGTPTLDQNPLITVRRSVLFDNVNDFVLSNNIFNNSQATVEVWFDYDGTLPPANQCWLIAGCVQGDNGSTTDKIILIRQSGKVTFYVFDGVGQAATGTTVLSSGIYHLVGTYDGVNAKIWVNGIEEGSQAASSTFTGYTASNVIVAGDANLTLAGESVQRKAGRRDEFAIYTAFIGASRIAAHYNAGVGAAAADNPPIGIGGRGAGW